MKRRKRKFQLRRVVEEVVFGVEDSLVSTVAALTGIAVGTQSTYVVVLSGIVLIFAEATSMTAGSYLSSKSEAEVWLQEHSEDWDELMRSRGAGRGPIGLALRKAGITGEDRKAVLAAVETQRKRWLGQVIQHERAHSPAGMKTPVLAGIVMGLSYLSAGAIPLLAYLFLPVEQAVWPSIGITLVALFAFGAWKASFTKQSRVLSGVEMVVIASAAAAIAYVLGMLVRVTFGAII